MSASIVEVDLAELLENTIVHLKNLRPGNYDVRFTVSGNAVVDGLTDPQGSYNLVGVPPGNYNVLVLPLGAVYGLDDFGGWYCGYSVNSPPCCDPKTDAQCTGTPISNPIDYTGKFF